MRKIILALSLMVGMSATAQDFQIVKGNCLPDLESGTNRAPGRYKLPAINSEWDATKTYHQLVVLLEFVDEQFHCENPQEYYDKMLNEPGYNQGAGAGCMADYFREQSNGLFNLQFDVYGPYAVSQKAQPYDNPTENTRNYGAVSMKEATQKFLDANPSIDFSQYDWNGDGKVNQVVFINAGVPGNVGSYGYIWPNTSSFKAITTPDGKVISNYTITGEIWSATNKYSFGFGTICHEYSHALGLPDIYPTKDGVGFSVCDEWDLMDGGNFTNRGWCPPNFTAMEKMLLGWLIPIDLTGPTTIAGLKPSAEGGEVYRIMYSDSEWLLLENRQQSGWDFGAPGKGLVIYHVNYDGTVWSNNSVNNDKNHRRFHLFHADNMDYDAWDKLYPHNSNAQYVKSPRLNNRHLSTSPYPYVVDGEVMNNQLTDTSTPAAVMHYPDGTLLGKPITNIRMSEDGLISFDFMGGDPTGIRDIKVAGFKIQECYDLQGRRVGNPQQGNLYIVRTPQGIRKRLYR